jgi:hypothetical protein
MAKDSPSSINTLTAKKQVKTYTATSTLIHILKQLMKEFQHSLEAHNIEFKFEMVENLTLLIGGGIVLNPNLIHDGFILLNNTHTPTNNNFPTLL